MLSLPLVTVSAANIKCWTNDEGIRECGQVVPPEHAQKRIEILNERGIVVKIKEAAKTKAELAKEAELNALKKEQQRKQAEQHRKDNILLRTYTTEHDLDISHKNKVQVVRSIIDITNGNIIAMRHNLDTLLKKAADYERGGQESPKSLLEDIENLKQQIQNNQVFIARQKIALYDLNTRYKTDLKRFRQLKGSTPTSLR